MTSNMCFGRGARGVYIKIWADFNCVCGGDDNNNDNDRSITVRPIWAGHVE